MRTFDEKKVAVVGNSFIYYGGFVEPCGQRQPNRGIFRRLCRDLGEDVTVYNCTYGGHHFCDFTEAGCRFRKCVGTPCYGSDLLRGLDLSSFDAVIFSESGDNNPDFTEDARNIMRRFNLPATEFVYLCHTYTYYRSHTHVLDGMNDLRAMGVRIADWGRVCWELTENIHRFPDGNFTYTPQTFIKNRGDSHHPNPLGGYLAAVCAYCAYTGRSAVGLPVPELSDVRFSGNTVGPLAYREVHYKAPENTEFVQILRDPHEILLLQQLCDRVLAEYM